MYNIKYAKAYTEVLEIIKYLQKDEYIKIPINILDHFKNNMDKNYKFDINPEIDLLEQNISKESFAIIICLFTDYFATDKQKEILKNLLKRNQEKRDTELRKKYNQNDIFKNKKEKNENLQESVALVEYKESMFIKIFNKILKILHIR